MEKEEIVTGTEERFDPVSLEFREIVKNHIKLLRSTEDIAPEDLDGYEKLEAVNRQNVNVIAYCTSFMIYKFVDVDPFVQKSNISWVSKMIVRACTLTDKGRKMDKASYYFFKEKLREYLKSINTELTRIDNQPVDVWQHGYDKLDNALKNGGIQEVL